MRLNKVLINIGAILVLSGLIFSFLPHDIHNRVLGEAAKEGYSHTEHNISGYIIAFAGLVIAGIGWKIRR